MTDFSLLAIPSLLLEKVAIKFGEKAYCRLQQTCHSLYEFIGNSRNIFFCLDEQCILQYKKDFCLNGVSKYTSGFELKRACGARIRTITLNGAELKKKFESFCASLQQCRITCTKLEADTLEFTGEQYGVLVKLLKPGIIALHTDVSNRVDVLLQQNRPKEIHVRLDESDISDVAPKLLSSFSKVAIYGTRQITGQLSTICKAIELLRYKPSPKLCQFRMFVFGTWDSSTKVLEHFNEYKLEIESETDTGMMTVQVDTPEHFPSEFSCKIVIAKRNRSLFVELLYGKEELVSWLSVIDKDE